MIKGVYEDILCKEIDGKWKCKLYKEPMFEPVPIEEKVKVHLPTGEVKEAIPEEVVKVKRKRKHDLVEVDKINVYGCYAVTVSRDAIRITPGDKILNAEYYVSKFGDRILHVSCEEPLKKPFW